MKKICLLLSAIILFSTSVQAHAGIVNSTTAPLDLVGPAITYSLLAQSSCVPTRSFTASITDIDGVNTTPGTKPRVYYKRTTDANTWVDNTNATNGWKYTEATNASSPFDFTIDYSLVWGGSVTAGQNIQYFIVAQDLAGTPNIGVSSGTTFTIAPTSVALTASAFPIGGAISFYAIVNALPSTITIGAFGDFSTLTAAGGAFNAINNVGLSGNTTLEIIDPLITETNAFPLYQVQNTGCAAGSVSLVIKPASGVSPTLTGSRPNEPIIRILSSNVTVDGSNNGTSSRNMTLTNTNATSPSVILFGSLNSATAISNSILKNTICINTLSITNCVVVSDGNVGGNPGYFSNITIQNNSIQRSQIGINCAAVASSGNGSILITGNDLNAASPNQIGAVGIYTKGLDAAVISNNNIGNFETTVVTPRYGIWLDANTVNSTISANSISNIAGSGNSGSGSALTTGIYISTAFATSNDNITGNTISNIVSGATGTVAAQEIACGINIAGATGGITLRENKISNIKQTNTLGYGAYGIGLSSTNTAANITVANNFIFDVAGYGVATVVRNGVGIFMGAGGGYKIYHNSVAMNTNQTNPTTSVSAALMISGVTTASSVDIRNNILANMQTAGVPIATRYSIYSANANTIFSNIDNNDYYVAGTNLGFLGGARTTLADIITGFGGNTASINMLPAFVSSTDLHLLTNNCYIDNRGTPVGITTDIDAAVRDLTTPDIGADEFSSVINTTLAGLVGAAICDNRTVSTGGTNYVNTGCNLIARVVPSGASPVSGFINACVTRDASQQYFNGDPYVQRHYDIEPANSAATATATVTLYFTDQEFIDYNTLNGATWPLLPTNGPGNTVARRNNVRITQFHGTPTGGLPTSTPGNYTGAFELITPGAANVSWNGNYWEVTFNVTGFSGFYLHTSQFNTPLPIVVNYLNGRRQNDVHLLNWKVTCTATPRATMELQRSTDTRNFTGIYSISADAARCQQPFDYTDASPLPGINYYRLKITDANGRVTYSTTVALLNAVNGFDLVSLVPNPVVNGNFKLNVASAKRGNMDIRIYDMQGRLVNRQSLSLVSGFNSLPVDVSLLGSGTYTVKATMMGEPEKLMRFVKL